MARTDWDKDGEAYEKEAILFEFEKLKSVEEVRLCIANCEGKHKQQAMYSTFHHGLTQICFGCRKIRSSISA